MYTQRSLTKLVLLTLFFTQLVQLGRVNSDPTRPLFACNPSNPQTNSYPFCNTSLPIPQRVKDIVTRLSIDEKIAQLTNSAPPIQRLGIPAYEWWSESLHGVSRHGRGFRFNATFDPNGTIINSTAVIKAATMFPQIILSAASFDSFLWYRIARAIATEARAMYNVGQGKGLTFWAPNINIFRDPRWGRGQETPGEDPLLTSRYGVSYVRGLQGYTFQGKKISSHLQASACCKHFIAHDLDNWHGITRYTFDAQASKQDLADTFQPPFQNCVEQGQASSIMCAYNRVNGVPSCVHRDFLTHMARGQWNFDGYIVSDCNAVPVIYEQQGYAKTQEDAVAGVLNAGMDVECGSYTQRYTKSTLEKKKLTEDVIDRALTNLFSVRMRLGLFDGNPNNDKSFGNIGPRQVCSKEHRNLALEASRSGIVLLKNSNKLLPLSNPKNISLAVIGPNADSPQVLLGNYEGIPCKTITPLEALRSYVKNVKYHSGCDSVNCSSASIDEVVQLVKDVDHVVMVMGLDQTQEREKMDRLNLILPGKQTSLIERVANEAKIPIVVVFLCGGPIDISIVRDNDKVGGILWAGYPGEAGGTALAEVIFGDHNPGGRLPMTWYPQEFVQIPMTDMRMRSNKSSNYPGRTYRFYNGKKVFEFGYGLSYSTYLYEFTSVKNLNPNHHFKSLNKTQSILVSELSTHTCDELKLSVVVRVKNNGTMAGKHPVLLFVRFGHEIEGGPIKQLIGFEIADLNGGDEKELEFVVSPCEHVSVSNEDGLMMIWLGDYVLVVGEVEKEINITL